MQGCGDWELAQLRQGAFIVRDTAFGGVGAV